MRQKRTVTVILCAILILACGCGQQEISESDENSLAIYQRFLDGEEPVYFREADQFEGRDLTLPVEAEVPYWLEDICSIINQVGNGGDSIDEFDGSISYAYIDCGADGDVELALKFEDIDELLWLEEVTLIIKDMDGRLEICYMLQPYYRETWKLANIYGRVDYWVNIGTGTYGDQVGYIGADGVYDLVYYVYNDVNSYYLLELPEDFPYEIPEDEVIVLKAYTFELYDQDVDYKEYLALASLDLTMSGYHYNTGNCTIDIGGLSRAVAEATGMELYSLEEIQAMIAAREAELGLTEEIKNGPEVEWHTMKIKDFHSMDGHAAVSCQGSRMM